MNYYYWQIGMKIPEYTPINCEQLFLDKGWFEGLVKENPKKWSNTSIYRWPTNDNINTPQWISIGSCQTCQKWKKINDIAGTCEVFLNFLTTHKCYTCQNWKQILER